MISRSDYARSILLALAIGGICVAGVAGLAVADVRVRGLLFNSLQLAFATAAFSVPVGGLLGLLVARYRFPGRMLAAGMLGLLVFLPLYLQSAAWEAGFGKAGWFTMLWQNHAMEFGEAGRSKVGSIGSEPFLNGWRGAWWVHSMAAIGWSAMIVGLGATRYRTDLEDQARQDTSRLGAVVRITLPRLTGYVAVSVVWVLLWTLGEMTVTDRYLVRTYAEEVYTGFALGDSVTDAWIHALPLVLVIGALGAAALMSLLYLGEQNQHEPAQEPHFGREQTTARRPGSVWRWLVSIVVLPLVAVPVLLPLGSLFYQAGFTVVDSPGGPQATWTVAALGTALAEVPQRFARELLWTLAIGGLAATWVTSLAALWSWAARASHRGAGAAFFLAAALLAIPAPLLGVSVSWFFNSQPLPALTALYRQSLLGPVLTTGLRSFPFVLVLLWLAFRSISTDAIDQARLDGLGFWKGLLQMAVLLRRASLSLAWIVGFTIAAGDVATVILARPVEVTPVAVRLFQLAHSGVREQEAALALWMTGLSLLLAGLAWISARAAIRGRSFGISK